MSYTKGKLKINSDTMVGSINDVRVLEVSPADKEQVYGQYDYGPITEANAREFVKRWNCHEGLVEALRGDEENCIPNAPMILAQALLGNYEAVKSMLSELCSINAQALAAADSQG